MVMTVKHYGELIAWQRAMDLVERVYKATEGFPRREMFGLTNQLRRAVVSIPSNIAEGQGWQTTCDFLHFLSIANGSLQEVETQLMIARRLTYLDEHQAADLLGLAAEVGRIIGRLSKAL